MASSLAANQHPEEINIAISVDASDQIEAKVSHLLEKIRHDEQELPPICRHEKKEQPLICRHPFGDLISQVDDLPKICSIGPIHSGRPEIGECDADKLRLFGETRSLQDGPQICHGLIHFVQQHKDEAAEYYSTEVVIDEEKFVIMLVLDAHFILRLIFHLCGSYIDKHLYERWIGTYVSETVFYHDFLLLSNQIPFFILQGCFDRLPDTNKPSNCSSLQGLLLSVFIDHDPPSSLELISEDVEQFDHLLHFYRNAVIAAGLDPTKRTSNLEHQRNCILTTILYLILFPWFCFLLLHWLFSSDREPTAVTAVELQDAGVKFNCHTRYKLEIRFYSYWGGGLGCIDKIWFKGGTLNLPGWHINNDWFSRMWSLLAFEKMKCKKISREVTNHLKFICDMVSSKDDYRLLAEHGILYCPHGEDFGFQKINKLKLLLSTINDVRDPFFLSLWHYEIRADMKRYMKEPQHRWRAKLMKDYFNSPWSIVGWVVGGVLLLLTLLQTIYTIKSYFHSAS